MQDQNDTNCLDGKKTSVIKSNIDYIDIPSHTILAKYSTIKEINVPGRTLDVQIKHTAISNLTRLVLNRRFREEKFVFDSSTIERVYRFACSGNRLIISNTVFNEVNSLSIHLMSQTSMTNVTFGHVKKHGIVVSSDMIEMSNIVFESVERYGLIFDENVSPVLRNVTIKNCLDPCIIIKKGFAESDNLVIEGAPVTHRYNLNILRYQNSFPFSLERKLLSEHHQGCERDHASNGLTCDLKNFNEVSECIQCNDEYFNTSFHIILTRLFIIS